MPEERGLVMLDVRIEERFDRLENSVSELRGTTGQIDKRLSNLEQLQRWGFGIMVGSWITLMMSILGLYFKQ